MSVTSPSTRSSRIRGNRRAGARGLDAAVGGVFGEVQDPRAIREERRTTFAEIEPPRVDFHQRRDEARRRLAFAHSEPPHFGEQIRDRRVERTTVRNS